MLEKIGEKYMKKIVVLIFVMLLSSINAKDFKLNTLSHKSINIKDFEGNLLFQEEKYKNKNLLFFFFGTRCPYCEKEIPQIINLVKKYKIKVIGIQAQGYISDQELKKFVLKKQINFDVLNAKDGYKIVRYLQSRRLWVGGVPFYIWCDKFGNLEPLDITEVFVKVKH